MNRGVTWLPRHWGQRAVLGGCESVGNRISSLCFVCCAVQCSALQTFRSICADQATTDESR